MNKVYELSHVEQFDCGHEDEKLIGIFSSKEDAQEKIKDFKKLKGFKDNPEGFCIREYVLDEIDNKSLSQLIGKCQSR